MKKILAATLAVLMLLPMLASIVSAAFVIPEGVKVENVASKATISVTSVGDSHHVGETVDLSKLVDGDRTTGTNSPLGRQYSYNLNYDDTYIFSEITVACNGSGTLASGETVDGDTFNVSQIVVRIYYGEEMTYNSGVQDVSKLKTLTLNPETKDGGFVKGDRVEVYKVSGTSDRNEYMWEIETMAPQMEVCNAQYENVASEAVFSATGANANYWWAMNYKSWVDGDPNTGSRSPKGRNYSVWMHFNKEYLFSAIDIVCNTDGGAKLASGETITEKYYGNSMMRVRVYNYNEDLVWDSDMIDTSTVTSFSVSPYIEGAIIEICFYNGNFSGGEYMYEVSAWAQSGSHQFTKTAEENPTCLVPGFRELTCQCGKVIKQAIPATGFHKWSDVGEITKGASATENGVMSYPCAGCDLVKNRDIEAIGHNWDSGVTVAPKCEEEGYVLHKCIDEGCELTYKSDYKDALVHIWDDGAITKKPTVEEEGVITYKCSVCNGEKYGRIRKHKYTDSTTIFNASSVTDWKEVQTTPFEAEHIKPENLLDGQIDTYWHGLKDSYVELTLDKEYIFTSGLFYATANWAQIDIYFYALNPEFDSNQADSEDNPKYIETCKYNTGNVNTGGTVSEAKELDMLDALGGATKASKIKIVTRGEKTLWNDPVPGSGCKLLDLKLTVHKCEFTADDYINDSNFKAPTCGTDGSCNAKCQVCQVISPVVIPATVDNSHKFGDVQEVKAPTCMDAGVGSAECTVCNKVIQGITIPATGKHSYTEDEVLVSAKCGFAGVGCKKCEYCDKEGEIYEIAPTGVHEYEWTIKSQAAYTADGIEEYCCIFCDKLDPATEENVKVAEKIGIPDNILTFVEAKTSTDAEKGNALTFVFRINADLVKEIEKTCDIRVISTIKDAQGREASIESYGKYAKEGSYDAETGKLTVTIYPGSSSDVFEINTCIRFMNFRGIVYKYYTMGKYGTSLSIDAVK